MVSQVRDGVYGAAEHNKGGAVAGRYQDTLSKWERVLGDDNDSAVLRAIDCKGDLSTTS